MVGMVVTISPSFNLYRIVVLPAASKPTGNTECDSKHIKTFASQFFTHQYPHLLLPKQPAKQAGNGQTHALAGGDTNLELQKLFDDEYTSSSLHNTTQMCVVTPQTQKLNTAAH